VRSQGGKAHVTVVNSGQTIPSGDIPYIFDRFYKADRSRSRDKAGLGLGLYLVRRILNAHNEDIFVSSSDGRTEFSFSLPSRKP
jgi:signal transduction histidine kinase